jgi:outer membrane protein OmpA-like peptidoglycan-associated protein/uncharacterized protein YidB (DUF937 family)
LYPPIKNQQTNKTSKGEIPMALFDSIVNEVDQKFGLGDKAAPLLAGLLSLMTNEQSGGLAGFVNRFKQAGMGDLVSSWISTGANQPITENQLQSALGSDTISRLASKAGVAIPLATSALAFLVPKVIDFLTPNGAVPSGTPTAVSSFLSGAGDVGRAAAQTAAAGGSSLLKWLPLVLLVLLAFLGYQYCNRPAENLQTAVTLPTVTPTAVSVPSVAASVIAKLGEFIERKLPNGLSLRVPSNGVESQLIAFIEDPNRKVDKETWFNFDRLEFETDSAVLKPTSEEQLKNIADILKAYPNVNVKIGGYTDNVGKDDYNLKLSGERATNTMNEIVKLGIDKSRLTAEGYGKEHPVADNSTEEGRQQNRRIALRVTKK